MTTRLKYFLFMFNRLSSTQIKNQVTKFNSQYVFPRARNKKKYEKNNRLITHTR